MSVSTRTTWLLTAVFLAAGILPAAAQNLSFDPGGKYALFSPLPGAGEPVSNGGSHYYYWIGALADAVLPGVVQESAFWIALGVMTWERIDANAAIDSLVKELRSSIPRCTGNPPYAFFLGKFPWGPPGVEGGKMVAWVCGPAHRVLEGRYGHTRVLGSGIGPFQGHLLIDVNPDASPPTFEGTFLEDGSRPPRIPWRATRRN